MSEMAIQVKDLSKVYKLYNKPSDRLKETLGFHVDAREHYALKHVNFEIRKGETVGIIGTNGSGKSTILKIITGVLNPTGGTYLGTAGAWSRIQHGIHRDRECLSERNDAWIYKRRDR